MIILLVQALLINHVHQKLQHGFMKGIRMMIFHQRNLPEFLVFPKLPHGPEIPPLTLMKIQMHEFLAVVLAILLAPGNNVTSNFLPSPLKSELSFS
jgi:hypothetical protein